MRATVAKLEAWPRRPIEEANLFNPAFLGGLTYEFVKDYSKEHDSGTPLTLIVIGLSASLHRLSRERLPHSTVSYLYGWLQENEDILVGFSERAKNIGPYIKQAIMFGIVMNVIQIGEGHCLLPGSAKASFPKSFLDQTTSETKSIIASSKFMARWFAKSGSEISIAAAWGVKP